MLGFNGGRIGVANTVFTEGDPNYSSVSLLLNGNGTNGSTTFTDSSSYGHTVTANGNAQISTTQSKFGGASMYFDGSGDYLSVPDDTSFHLGSDNFTFEFWTYLNSTPAPFINKQVPGQTGPKYLYFYLSGGSLRLWATSNGSTWDVSENFAFGNTALSTGQWYHIALVRNGTEIAAYVNGIKSPNTITTSAAINDGNTIPLIIAADTLYGTYQNAYIDDLRITKGVARYTSNFTPPTAELPGGETETFASGVWTSSDHIKQIRNELWPGFVPSIVTDGLVLNLDAGDSASYPGSGTTWTDLSGNGNDGTLVNGVGYDSANGGSLTFDGVNDGVSVPGTNLSLNQMTISSWNYSTNYNQNGFMFEKTTNGNVNTQYSLFYNATGNNSIYYRTFGLSSQDLFVDTTTAGVVNNQWNNIVATFDGSQKKIYVNGVLRATQNVTGTVTQNSTGLAYIGIYGNFAGYPFNGNIASTQIYNKALTSSEVTQNFDALKGRYGL